MRLTLAAVAAAAAFAALPAAAQMPASGATSSAAPAAKTTTMPAKAAAATPAVKTTTHAAAMPATKKPMVHQVMAKTTDDQHGAVERLNQASLNAAKANQNVGSKPLVVTPSKTTGS
jgi:hypothetical protein